MYGRALALGIGFLVASPSYAGVADVEVLFNVQGVSAPYDPGSTIIVDVLLSRVATGDVLPVRMLQLDFSASHPDLGLALSLTHDPDLVSDQIHFWYFTGAFTGICLTDDAADCGQNHYLEDDLAGTRPDVISMAYLGFAANTFEELMIPGDSAQSIKVGVIEVTLPVNPGFYILDLMNATLDDPDAGGAELHASHDLPLTPFRAFDGTLGGVPLELEVGDPCTPANIDFAALDLTEYPCDASLSRNGNNVLRFLFDITLDKVPAPGDIEINELQGPGVYGPDISASFDITIENLNVLKITEVGTVLSNETWYAVRNIGNWGEAGDFEVDYAVVYGDADGFGGTSFGDLAAIFNVLQNGLPANSLTDSSRFDIDGFGGISFGDIAAAFNFNNSSAGANPSPTGCTP